MFEKLSVADDSFVKSTVVESWLGCLIIISLVFVFCSNQISTSCVGVSVTDWSLSKGFSS